jgi:hypothetical protein
MSVWRTAPVQDHPVVRLVDWKIIRVSAKGEDTIHFVGFDQDNREGRVSSAILKMRRNSENEMIGFTSTGREYKAQGAQGTNSESEYVLARWVKLHGFSEGDISLFQE